MTNFLVSYIVSVNADTAEEAAQQLLPSINRSHKLDIVVAPLDNASNFEIVTIDNGGR